MNPETALSVFMGLVALSMIGFGVWFLKDPDSTDKVRRFLKRIDS